MKKIIKILLTLLILLLCFTAAICFGSQKLSLNQIILGFSDKTSFEHTVIFTLRIPRAILVAISGALLASAGASFQMFFRNNLAEPGLIGISSGATLGAVLAQLAGSATFLFGTVSPVSLFAFFGSLISGLSITLISLKTQNKNNSTILLCGTAIGSFYAAISSILLITKMKNLNGIFTWILGSFNGKNWNDLKLIIFPAILSQILILFSAPKLDLMNGGESNARALGLKTESLRFIVLLSSSLSVGAAVCAGGTINFIGLIAPHLVRKLFGTSGTKGTFLIPASMLLGSILLLISDTLARILIAPAELPAGLLTSLLGAPFFISLIFARQEK